MDVTRSAGYSGRPYTAHLRVYTLQVSGNSSRYHHDAWATSNSGYGSYSYNDSTCNVWVAGDYWGHFVSDMLFGPSGDYAGKSRGFGSGDGNWKAHDGNGNLSFVIRIQHPAPSPFGTADTGDQWVAADRIGAVPGQVSGVTSSAVTPTQATISWSTPSRGNSDINNYDLHVCTDTSFAGGPSCPHYSWIGSAATSKVVTGLNPGTTYYVRVRAQNGDGQGAWSATYSFTTLPSTPPTLSVVASPAGSSASVTLTPPGGISTVDKYTVRWEYLAPAPIPNPSVWTQDTTTPTATITGLIPGATYRWSATATIGTYVSPSSANQDLVQPKPSTSAGDYFDGSTTPPVGSDVTYAWTGTASNSTSVTQGQGVLGWSGQAVSGGAFTLHRVTGGQFGFYGAQVTVSADLSAAAPGLRVGIDNSDPYRTNVEPLTTYVGSIYVAPSRQQRLAAELTWVTAAGALISRSAGTAVLAPVGQWTRLAVTAQSPSNVEFALIRFIDASGTGWSQVVAGDTFRADGAMISLGELFPYFDGDTPDTLSYDYSWLGTANNSQSTRTPLSNTIDPLADPDCPPVATAPRPPTVPSDCISDVGVWRRYWAYIPADQVTDWLTTIPTLELETAGNAERQVRVRMYPNPFNRPTDQIDPSDFCSEQIISYIPPNTRLTIDGVTERVWAEVEGGSPLSADHLLYGSDGTPAAWPHLSCGIGYWASFDVPNEAPAGNLSIRVLLTERT